MLAEVLTAAQAIEDSSGRAYALRELAPHLPVELLSEVLTAARSLRIAFPARRPLVNWHRAYQWSSGPRCWPRR